MIVDDSEEDLILAERVLRQCKITNPIVKFSSGEELLKHFAAPSQSPVLVLLDIMMPDMHGTEILKEAKKRGIVESIPFVMLSGLRDFALLKDGYQHGARTFLVKPLSVDDIVQVLGKLKGLQIRDVEGGYVLASDINGRK